MTAFKKFVKKAIIGKKKQKVVQRMFAAVKTELASRAFHVI